jgi:hypothetical protein
MNRRLPISHACGPAVERQPRFGAALGSAHLQSGQILDSVPDLLDVRLLQMLNRMIQR